MSNNVYSVYLERNNMTVPMQHIITRKRGNLDSMIVAGFGHIAIISHTTGVNPIYLLQIKRIEDVRNFVAVFINNSETSSKLDEVQTNYMYDILDAIEF